MPNFLSQKVCRWGRAICLTSPLVNPDACSGLGVPGKPQSLQSSICKLSDPGRLLFFHEPQSDMLWSKAHQASGLPDWSSSNEEWPVICWLVAGIKVCSNIRDFCLSSKITVLVGPFLSQYKIWIIELLLWFRIYGSQKEGSWSHENLSFLFLNSAHGGLSAHKRARSQRCPPCLPPFRVQRQMPPTPLENDKSSLEVQGAGHISQGRLSPSPPPRDSALCPLPLEAFFKDQFAAGTRYISFSVPQPKCSGAGYWREEKRKRSKSSFLPGQQTLFTSWPPPPLTRGWNTEISKIMILSAHHVPYTHHLI